MRSTGSARGNGAFAAMHIAKGAHIADYEGDLLDLKRYYSRYPDGVVRTARPQPSPRRRRRRKPLHLRVPLRMCAAGAQAVSELCMQGGAASACTRGAPSMQSDYCMGLDDEWALDGRERAADVSAFSGCHINHSSKRYNVVRRTRRAEQVVELFASRDIGCDIVVQSEQACLLTLVGCRACRCRTQSASAANQG